MKSSIIIFLIGFLTIAPSIFIGIKYFDGKVTEQPYESGLTYDQDKKFISDNGLGLSITKNTKLGETVNIEFTFDKNDGVKIDEASFFITRPATNQEQLRIEAKQINDGTYASVFSLNTYGHYILKAASTVNGKKVLLQKSFYIN